MLTTNMAAKSLTDKADAYDREQQKKKMQRVYDHVTMLRVTEFATGGVVSVGMGALKAARPDFEEAFYGLAIDGTVAAVGGVLFFMAGEKKSGDYMREVGGGMAGAGIYSLGQKAGAKVYEYATAAA